jgi:hypothetical protein
LQEVFRQFCEEVGTVGIGVAARSSQLSVSMGEQLLSLHMKGEQKQKARAISEALNRRYLHHGYPVSRTEASDIGLNIIRPGRVVEKLMWLIWEDVAQELKLREPFLPLALLHEDAACQALFGPVPQLALPANLPPQILQQIIQQLPIISIPPKEFSLIHAIMESPRLATRCVSEGTIFASRMPDLQVRLSVVQHHGSWRTVPEDGGRRQDRRADDSRSKAPQDLGAASGKPAALPTPAGGPLGAAAATGVLQGSAFATGTPTQPAAAAGTPVEPTAPPGTAAGPAASSANQPGAGAHPGKPVEPDAAAGKPSQGLSPRRKGGKG